MHKIVLWGPQNTKMAMTVTLGLGNPPTATNSGGQKWLSFTLKTAWIKIVQKRRLESTEHKNGKDSNFRSDSNKFRRGTKMAFIYLEGRMDKNCSKTWLESTEHKNGKNSNFRFGYPPSTVTNLGEAQK